MTRHLPCLCETICNVLIYRFYTYCLFASAKIPPGRRQEQSMKAAPSAHLVRALIRGHHVATQAQRPGAKTRPAPRPAGANLRMQICTSSPAAPEWPASASPNATRPRHRARPCSSVRAVLWPLRGHASAATRGRAAPACHSKYPSSTREL